MWRFRSAICPWIVWTFCFSRQFTWLNLISKLQWEARLFEVYPAYTQFMSFRYLDRIYMNIEHPSLCNCCHGPKFLSSLSSRQQDWESSIWDLASLRRKQRHTKTGNSPSANLFLQVQTPLQFLLIFGYFPVPSDGWLFHTFFFLFPGVCSCYLLNSCSDRSYSSITGN